MSRKNTKQKLDMADTEETPNKKKSSKSKPKQKEDSQAEDSSLQNYFVSMSSSVSANDRVAQIFKTAGRAFSELGELTMQLHDETGGGHKWTEEDINQLQSSIVRFSEDIHKISERVKDTTVSQINSALQKKSFEKSPPVASMTNTSPSSGGLGGQGSASASKTVLATKSKPGGNMEVTLNMLNASDGDVDTQRIDFDSSGVISP